MPEKTHVLDTSLENVLPVVDLRPGDLAVLRHLILGESILDWTAGLHFRSEEEVNAFLRVLQYDVENRVELERLLDIHKAAVEYCRTTLDIDIPASLAQPPRIQDLFLTASLEGPTRSQACMLLKVMHVINHLEARELLYHLPISERELFSRVERRVTATVNAAMESGLPIDSYEASLKTKESLITKLLSKREDTAAQVFDRIRFRIIASNRRALVPTLLFLTKHLIPFPYVIPGESSNTIAPLGVLINEWAGRPVVEQEAYGSLHRGANPFSHKEFRVISMVVDIPIRVGDLTDPALRPLLTKFGHLVFIPTEFQIFDKASYFLNESGPAAHHLYKARQIREVIARLSLGSSKRTK